MHATIQTLKNALAYARFSNAEIKFATERLVDELGIDLQGVDAEYEPGSGVESAVAQLVDALDADDAIGEETDAALADAKGESVDEDGEDGG